MYIDVSKILSEGEGVRADFAVKGETPTLEGLILTSPISGSIQVIGTKDGVLAAGRLATDIELECDRCLRVFEYHLEFPLKAEFNDEPEEDQFPIDRAGKIDLSEPLRQEIEVHKPLVALCQDDCNGIELKQKKDS